MVQEPTPTETSLHRWRTFFQASLLSVLIITIGVATWGRCFIVIDSSNNDMHNITDTEMPMTMIESLTTADEQEQLAAFTETTGETIDSISNLTMQQHAKNTHHHHGNNNNNNNNNETLQPVVRTPKSDYATQFTLEELVSRNHFFTRGSICNVVRWIVGDIDALEVRKLRGFACRYALKHDEDNRILTDPNKLSNYDTIFVAHYARRLFVDTILPNLDTDVVVIVGWPDTYDPDNLDIGKIPYDPHNSDIILNHDRVVHVFAFSPWRSHPKLDGLPLGLPTVHVKEYIKEFQKVRRRKKHGRIFISYLQTGPTRPDRVGIPSAPQPMEYKEYIRTMHRHQYVLSPNGDHPDCYRHWEAIGLGTIPITMLQRDQYEFMASAPVIFNEPLPWNVSDMERRLPHDVTANRRMVFEEYWYEYMEETVGRTLLWSPTSYWTYEKGP